MLFISVKNLISSPQKAPLFRFVIPSEQEGRFRFIFLFRFFMHQRCQINGLEDELGVKLFIRTNKGVLLTESGKVFYDASEDLLRRFAEAVQNTRDRASQMTTPIRFGFSPINPYQDKFGYYYSEMFDYRFSAILVSISEEFKGFMEEMKNLGAHVDMVPFFLGNKMLASFCQEFCLARIPMRVAMNINHPLANKEIIRFDDMNGQELVTLADSINSYYGEFNEKIRQKAPHVRFRQISFIDYSILNETVYGHHLLLTGAHLEHSHPLLRFLPLEEELLLPYGVYFSLTPSDGVAALLESFRDKGINGKVEDSPYVDFSDTEEDR